jgi:hypothetical protein
MAPPYNPDRWWAGNCSADPPRGSIGPTRTRPENLGNRAAIAEAERRFPVSIRIGVPVDGQGSRFDRVKEWLNENCGANGC